MLTRRNFSWVTGIGIQKLPGQPQGSSKTESVTVMHVTVIWGTALAFTVLFCWLWHVVRSSYRQYHTSF